MDVASEFEEKFNLDNWGRHVLGDAYDQADVKSFVGALCSEGEKCRAISRSIGEYATENYLPENSVGDNGNPVELLKSMAKMIMRKRYELKSIYIEGILKAFFRHLVEEKGAGDGKS